MSDKVKELADVPKQWYKEGSLVRVSNWQAFHPPYGSNPEFLQFIRRCTKPSQKGH